jgi:dsDNA-specific endonuclease/ATPase MutS2
LSRRIAYVEQSGIGASAAPEEISRIESAINRVRRDLRELHENTAADFHDFEVNLKTQANAIESARTAMAQTDGLVERMVQVLESLQSSVSDQSEDRLMPIG